MSNSIRMFEREASTKGIRLSFSLAKKYRALQIGWVRADPIRFSQIIVNFISNAVRFTENALIRVIEVTLDASDEVPDLPQPLTTTNEVRQPQHFEDGGAETVYLIVSVADTGVGLTPGERVKLFQKFSQASPKTYSQYGGSGLGLFISKALVEVQGGRIALDSEKDKGTTVTFYIRCKRLNNPLPDGTPMSRDPSKPSIGQESGMAAPSPLNILVVEDNLVRHPTV
jgi:signal transduction histidine kinase